MPRMACIDCGAVHVDAPSWQTMLVNMMPHYFEVHHDIIAGHRDHPNGAWMKRFMAAFEEAMDSSE